MLIVLVKLEGGNEKLSFEHPKSLDELKQTLHAKLQEHSIAVPSDSRLEIWDSDFNDWHVLRSVDSTWEKITVRLVQVDDPNAIRADPKFRECLTTPQSFPQQPAAAAPLNIADKKRRLVNMVGTFLLKEPKFVAGTPATDVLVDLVKEIAAESPEFPLKLAMYVRTVLYLRSTTNFLLAVAAIHPPCRPYLRAYFGPSTNLPSDVLEVVELVRKVSGQKPLPTALRNVIQIKFGTFSIYQLGKYNTEGADKRRKKAAKVAAKAPEPKAEEPEGRGGGRGGGRGRGAPTPAPAPVQAGPPPTPKPTLKELINVCHISQPALAVISLMRKHYPKDIEAFRLSGIEGEFDESKAGVKLRIPIPVTWETELSAKGNNAEVWNHLVTSKQLPFMAMLRNLRNCLEAGVSAEAHEVLLGRLEDEKQVIGSKQLPIRFLSAFEAVRFKPEQLEEMQTYAKEAREQGKTTRKVERKVGAGKSAKTITKEKPIALDPPTPALLQKYEEALDTAVKIATVNNIPPLRGKTLVFVDCSGSMDSRLSFGPNRKHALSATPHAKCTGKPMLEGEEFCLADYFASTGQAFSNKLSMHMIWIGQDLDLSCSFLSAEGEQVGQVSYTNLTYKGCTHSGDITSAPNGAEEVIQLDLTQVPDNVYCVMFTVNVFSGQTFDELEEAAISLQDDGVAKGEICAFRIAGGGKAKALVACSIFRKGTGWTFRCLNTPQDAGRDVASLAGKIREEFKAQELEKGTSTRRLVDVAMLMGLCVKYSCEDSEVFLYGAPADGRPGYVSVETDEDSILKNIERCHTKRAELGFGTAFPLAPLEAVLARKADVDTVMVISDNRMGSETGLGGWLKKYREEVNADLTFVSVDLLGQGEVGVELDSNPNDVLISGYSDQILRYIADRKQDQLAHVEAMNPTPSD